MDERPIYMISVAADLVGMHPQTLRIYENKGLIRPRRTAGNTHQRYLPRTESVQRRRSLFSHSHEQKMGCLKAVADYLPTELQPTCCGCGPYRPSSRVFTRAFQPLHVHNRFRLLRQSQNSSLDGG